MSVYRLSTFPSRVLYNPAISWSDDGKIAVCTDEGVVIMHPQTNAALLRKQLPIHLSRAPAPEHINEFDVGVDRMTVEKQVIKDNEPDQYCLMLNRTVSPSMKSIQCHKGYRVAMWSPFPTSADGRCVLATLTMDHRLCIQAQIKQRAIWTELIDLSQLYYENTKKVGWKMFDGEAVSLMDQLKARTYALAAMSLSWSWIFRDESQYESFIKCQKFDEDEPQETKTEFALLVVAMRSGHVIIWKNHLPLESKKDCQLVVTLQTQHVDPLCIHVCQVDDNLGFVCIGYNCGLVKAFVVRRYVDDGSISVGEATDVWKEKDSVPVKVISWNRKDRILFVAKGAFLFAFEVQAKSKSMEVAIIRSNHITVSSSLHINGLWYSNPDLHVSVQSGKLYTVRACKDQGLKMEHHLICLPQETTNWRSHGISTSLNGVFLATADSPSTSYCHLTLKEPLRVHITSLRTRKDVIELLLAPKEEHLGKLWDVLVFMRQVYLQENSPPGELECLYNNQEEWPSLSLYKLKLARYFLIVQQQLNKVKNKTSEEGLDMVEGSQDLDHLIMKKHVHGSLSNLVSAEYKDKAFSDQETSSVWRMCEWLEQQSHFGDGKIRQIVTDVKERLGADSYRPETCCICKQEITMEDCSQGSCEKRHQFNRCQLTLLMCQTPLYKQCLACPTYTSAIPDGYFKWLTCNPHECIFCDGSIVAV